MLLAGSCCSLYMKCLDPHRVGLFGRSWTLGRKGISEAGVGGWSCVFQPSSASCLVSAFLSLDARWPAGLVLLAPASLPTAGLPHHNRLSTAGDVRRRNKPPLSSVASSDYFITATGKETKRGTQKQTFRSTLWTNSNSSHNIPHRMPIMPPQ